MGRETGGKETRTIDEKNILSRVAMYRHTDAETLASYAGLVTEAVAFLEGLRNGKPGGETLLEAAAAALVNWELSMLDANEDFTAGDVKIANGGRGVSQAKALWEQARAAAGPYLAQDQFAFRRIGL